MSILISRNAHISDMQISAKTPSYIRDHSRISMNADLDQEAGKLPPMPSKH